MFLRKRILQKANGTGNAVHMLTCKLKMSEICLLRAYVLLFVVTVLYMTNNFKRNDI